MPHIPIFNTHPVAWVNPVTMRVSAILEAAGAWDPAPIEQNVAGAGSIMLSFTYDEDAQAANGAFDFQVQASIYSVVALAPTGAGEWGDESLQAQGVVAAGVDSQNLVQAEFQTFAPVGADAETFVYGPIILNHVVERIRIPCRESGDVAQPGILQITMEVYP